MVATTSLTWVSADSMQIRRFLKTYAGVFILAWYGALMICCAYGWGYVQVDLLSGVFPRVLSSTDQHQTAISNMLLFIAKDCFTDLSYPGCCNNIKGVYFKYWLRRGSGDRTTCGAPQAPPALERTPTFGLGKLAGQASSLKDLLKLTRDKGVVNDAGSDAVQAPSNRSFREDSVGTVKV